jgi:hypothetical protein
VGGQTVDLGERTPRWAPRPNGSRRRRAAACAFIVIATVVLVIDAVAWRRDARRAPASPAVEALPA